MRKTLVRGSGMTNRMDDSEVHTTALRVDGMSCGACVRHVTKALEAMTGVVHVDVTLREAQAIVEHLPAFVDTHALIQAVRDAGYAAQVKRTMPDTERRGAALDPPASCGCGCCAPHREAGWLAMGTSTIG
jgi:copper chaperone